MRPTDSLRRPARWGTSARHHRGAACRADRAGHRVVRHTPPPGSPAPTIMVDLAPGTSRRAGAAADGRRAGSGDAAGGRATPPPEPPKQEPARSRFPQPRRRTNPWWPLRRSRTVRAAKAGAAKAPVRRVKPKRRCRQRSRPSVHRRRARPQHQKPSDERRGSRARWRSRYRGGASRLPRAAGGAPAALQAISARCESRRRTRHGDVDLHGKPQRPRALEPSCRIVRSFRTRRRDVDHDPPRSAAPSVSARDETGIAKLYGAGALFAAVARDTFNRPVMPALVAWHPRLEGDASSKDVDGRDRPGHDNGNDSTRKGALQSVAYSHGLVRSNWRSRLLPR